MVTDTRSSPPGPGGSPIDPIAALRQLQANGDLEGPQATMLRVLWVRSDHPDTRVETELTHLHDDLVVFRALVALPGGASATGYASETGAPGENLALAIERAETRAIGRALDILGYVIPAGATPPARRNGGETNPPPVIDALRKASARRPQTGPVVLPEAEPEPAVDQDTGEIADAAGSSRVAPQGQPQGEPAAEESRSVSPVSPAPQPRQRPVAAEAARDVSGDPPLEDYTWTHFWRWARGHNLTTKGQVEQRIGRSLDNLTPADVRIALQESGIEL